MSEGLSEDQKREDEAESAEVAQVAKALGERFDAVVIMASRHEGSRGTRTINKGSGNWHAQYGLVWEWITSNEERARIMTRENAET